MGKVRTVRDFKDFILKRCGSITKFAGKSAAHQEFWQKLNDMGAKNIRTLPPEKVPDIDATVQLGDKEWDQLMAEFRQLK
jgi:hypothetical protein